MIGITIHSTGNNLLIDTAGIRIPDPFCRITVFFEQQAFFIGNAFPTDFDPELTQFPRVHFFQGKGLPFFAAVFVPVAATWLHAAFPVRIADQQVQGYNGSAVMVAVGVLDRTAIHIGHYPATITGELAGQGDQQGSIVKPGLFCPVFYTALINDIFQQAKAGFIFETVDSALGKQVANHRRIFFFVRIKCNQLTVDTGHKGIFIAKSDLAASQQPGSGLSGFVQDHQMGGIGPGGIIIFPGCTPIGGPEIGCIVAFIIKYPADHAKGQGSIATTFNRCPVISLGRRMTAARINHGYFHAVS